MPTSPSLSLSPPSLWRRIRSEGVAMVAGCLCLAATNGLALAIPWLLKAAVDRLGHADGAAAAAAARHLVTRNAILIVLFAVLQSVIRTWSRILIFNAGRNLEYTLRRDVFAHLLAMDQGFYRQHPTGDLMSRLTNDLSSVRLLFGPGLLNLVNTLLVYATSLWLLISLSPRLTLFALIPYPALMLGGRAFSRAMFRASRELQDQLGKLSTAVQEDLAGAAVVKQYALEPLRHAAFSRLNDEYLEKSLRLVRARGTMTPLFVMIGGIGTLIVLWAGGREVIGGRLSVGGLIAFNAYLAYLSWPTIALGWIISIWQRGIAGWVRVRELLATGSGIAEPTGNAGAAADDGAPLVLSPAIEARGITVRRDGRAILDDVSFSLRAGETLAIVGPTGSGKTTLVDAIPRLTDVPPGTLFVGGRDITTIPLRTLRGMIGYAPQEAFLFSASVADNIAFGGGKRATLDRANERPNERANERANDRALDRAAIERAAEAAGLARDVAALPDGYDTLVGERGITLSGGQRQRVALARALAADPRILILDDSLSSVDAETERDILSRLRPILAGRTSVLVSHRVAAVKNADQILVIDGGRVAERGTHVELLAAAGLYAALYREQLAAEALAQGAA